MHILKKTIGKHLEIQVHATASGSNSLNFSLIVTGLDEHRPTQPKQFALEPAVARLLLDIDWEPLPLHT